MAYKSKKTILEGAIEIYKRDSEGGQHSSNNWYAKLKIPVVGTKRVSLKTSIESEANSKAQKIYFEYCQRANQGLSLSPMSFSSVAKKFVIHFKEQVEIWKTLDDDGKSNLEGISENRLRNTQPIVEKYLVPFFGTKSIQEISEQDIEDYTSYRLGYWTSKEERAIETITYFRNGRKVTRPKRMAEKSIPSYSTINKELTELRKVFEFARKRNLISYSDIPRINRLRKPSGYDQKRERPSFSNDELTLLMNTIHKMYHRQKNPKHQLAHYRLYLYVLLLSCTGMRVTEAKNLRFKDIEIRREGGSSEHLALWVTGKNKGRYLVPFPECSIAIDTFRMIHRYYSKKHDWKFTDDTYVLTNERGKKIQSFSTALSNALEQCDLLHAKNGRRRSASSIRSFYITTALSSGAMTHIQLAINCGTSVSVIEKYYNRLDPTNFPEKFNFDNAASKAFWNQMTVPSDSVMRR